ncbi:MAG: 3-methyl-2-oxobutanoate hydroxymethyltransferase [Deltaproteobacteria bacterium]|nr:3-methyl-2-oxobutanoate hydroxymethyltransferase [Deltaproteobacteria bacterium]
MKTEKVTIHTLRQKKKASDRITMLTCYDASFARLLDDAGVDILLVGDSLGMVIQGHQTTLPVTLDEMIYHARAVARGTTRAQVVGDMPFMTYQASLDDAMRAAGRLVKEGGAEAVKLEGGAQHAELVYRLVSAGIPVMGHIGLTPQSFHQLGGFKIQGRDATAAQRLVDDARSLEQAGAYSLVLEGIPREVAADVTHVLSIPTIGIGAGSECDGQVLVIYDLLGMNDEFKPRFVRRYENLAMRIRTAVDEYIADVRSGQFPSEDESFSLQPQAKAPSRKAATVSAIALAGGCSPFSEGEMGSGKESASEETPFYGSPTQAARGGTGQGA